MSEWKLARVNTIDADRWDACVAARDGEVFSEYWYWNAVCSSWQAWVKGDYEDVMAIPTERKWGIIPLMRTPLYVKWIEGNEGQLNSCIRNFFGFKRIHTRFETAPALAHAVQILDLSPQWNPSKELVKNIRKAERENPELVTSVSWDDFHAFMHTFHPYAWPSVQQQRMHALFDAARQRGCGHIAGVKMNGQWAAMQFYIMRRGKAYLIQNVVSKNLRIQEPMAYLLHALFREWQHKQAFTRVNFMGSTNTGVARFNEKFGAETTYYYESR
jgi:Acetyltransferase (GNAT) domain